MPIPPLDFLLEASSISLQDLELASLNRSGNLSKALRHELEMWIEQAALAMLARWFIENREAILCRDVSPQIGPVSVELFTRDRKKSA
jgi:hypothetical protein